MSHPPGLTQTARLQDQLKESEERFRVLAEATFEAIAISRQGRVLEVNSHFLDLFEYAAADVHGMSVTAFHPAEEWQRVSTMNLSGDERPYRATCLRKGGSTFIGEIRGKAMPYAGERVRVTAIRDVTSYVEAHETLVRAQHELERRVEERTHELARLNEALIEKLSELELFERAVVGRELKMIELEQEIATLRQRLRNVP